MMNEVAFTKFAAYLLTDGCVTFEGDGGLYATLINKDEKILSDFQETLLALGLDSNITKQTRAFRVRKGCSKLVREFLDAYKIPIAGKKILKKEAQIPDFVFQSKILVSEFLRVVASTEGYVRFTKNRKGGFARRVVLGSLNEKFSKQLMNALHVVDIESKLSSQGVIIYGQDNLKRFAEFVGFVDGCKFVRGPKKGREKSAELKKLLLSFSRWAERP